MSGWNPTSTLFSTASPPDPDRGQAPPGAEGREAAYQRRVRNLEKLVETSALINSTLELSELLDVIMETAKRIMEADALSLMLAEEDTGDLVYALSLGEKGRQLSENFRLKKGQGIAGHVAETGVPVLIDDVYQHPNFFRKHDEETGYRTKSMICVPLEVKGRIIGVAQIINKLSAETFGSEDFELFVSFCRQAAIAVDNAKLHQKLLDKTSFEKELEFAHQVQSSFMPQHIPSLPGIQFAAAYEPAKVVSGDFYDFIAVDAERLGIVMGDVSGKGMPAALYMARLSSDFGHSVAQGPEPGRVLDTVNRALCGRIQRGMFATALYMLLDARTRTLRMANAGHLPPLLVRGDGEVLEMAAASHPPIGILPDLSYSDAEVSLSSGDLVVLYTDGVVEGKSHRNQLYGMDRFKKVLRRERESSPDVVLRRVLDSLRQFRTGAPLSDDVTLLLFRSEPNPASLSNLLS